MHELPYSAGSKSVLAEPAQRRKAALYAVSAEAFLSASHEEAYAAVNPPATEGHGADQARGGLIGPAALARANDIRVNIDPVTCLLCPTQNTRSSLYLEVAAREFQVRGLEVDCTIVAWDADLRWRGRDWCYHIFRGPQWTDVKKPERRQYLKNSYDLLLTRAGQEMLIFVPPEGSGSPVRKYYLSGTESTN